MANRYAVATGNWNSTATWSSSPGGASGASVPSIAGDDLAYITGNYTVSLTADAEVAGVVHTNGTLALGAYKLSVFYRSFSSTGTTARTLNLGSGILELKNTLFADNGIILSGSNLNVIYGTSLIRYIVPSNISVRFDTLNKTFNDVYISIGAAGFDVSSTVTVTGSPTFNLLDIRSANTAAHTVNFDGAASRVTVNKFIGMGVSGAQKLIVRTIEGSSPGGFIFTANATCYGQYLNIVDTHAYGGVSNAPVTIPVYVGSNSVKNNPSSAWIVQNPSKISTLVDHLTTAPGSNANWTVGGTITSVTTGEDAGGYQLASGASLLSAGTFDAIDSAVNFQTVANTSLQFITPEQTHALVSNKFYKFSVSVAGAYLLQNSDNGTSWTTVTSTTTTNPSLYRSMRVSFDGVGVIGTVNTSFNQSPTTILSTPANNTLLTTTTPSLAFTATDPEGEAVSYQVQVGNIDFTTIHATTTTASFASGTAQSYTVSPALTTGGIDYYWRVRAIDPTGSNSYGAWSEVRKMTTQAIAPTVTSGASSSLAATNATVAGNVTSNGGGTITERGAVYATTASPTTANSKKVVTGTTGAFTADLTALAPGTLYNWRAYAINAVGTSYGANQTFTTAPAIPTITAVYDVLDTSAKVDGEALAGGGATITAKGIVYSTSANPTLASSVITSGTGAGTFTATITGLTASTLYYVRPYATNATGTTYGVQSSFTTDQPNAVPTVITGTASSVSYSTADFLASQVTNDGNFAVTERGVVFSSTNPTPTILDLKATSATSGLGSYNVSITGLAQETTYYARAYATTSYGTGYGAVITFTTTVLFVQDPGDGYWTWTPSGSDAVIGRSQSTMANSSANLLLSDLNLENGETYTLNYSAKSNTNGVTKMVLQRFNGATKVQNVITAGTPYTFVYDETKLFWAIRLFVTGASVEANNITATFSDMYLAKEPTFSGFVPFVANGLTEIKIENNWLADKQRTDVISSMFSAMNGQSWYPFNIETEGLGWFEIGDKFTIQDDNGKSYPVVLWNSKLTIDGGIKETLFTKTPDLTETNYAKAGKMGGLWKRTQIEVDKNKQEIQSLVEDIYNYDGVINTKFSEVLQDVNEIRTTVQGTGGVNLIQNSVMYAFDTSNVPDSWTVTGAGTLVIQASPESLTAGAVAGNAFSLSEKTVKQTITVRKDVAFIPEAQKTYYAISAKVKKNTVGTAWIKLTNRNETRTIKLPDQTGYFWDTVKLEEILPLDDYYDIEIYSDDSADLQVTDLMFAPGKTKREWSQANGEVMNSSVSITKDGMTIRSPQFQNDYTKIDALGFEVHSKEVNGARVFGFNKDETNVAKLKADKQISMSPLRTVPINYGTYKGWAFTLSETI